MKAAVIDSPERGPRFADFAEPVVADGETLIEVTAAGLHPIVRMLASGEHYGSHGTLPMIPGIDGTAAPRTAAAFISVASAPRTAPWPSAPRPRSSCRCPTVWTR